jgi:hypothetical protein
MTTTVFESMNIAICRTINNYINITNPICDEITFVGNFAAVGKIIPRGALEYLFHLQFIEILIKENFIWDTGKV